MINENAFLEAMRWVAILFYYFAFICVNGMMYMLQPIIKQKPYMQAEFFFFIREKHRIPEKVKLW